MEDKNLAESDGDNDLAESDGDNDLAESDGDNNLEKSDEDNDSTESDEDNDSKSADTRMFYLGLLEGMKTVSDFTSKWNASHLIIEEASNISEIETIFVKVDKNIKEIFERLPFEKWPILLTLVLNTIVRFTAIEGSGLITSKAFFKSILEDLNNLIYLTITDTSLSPTCAGDNVDSLLLNFVTDGFIDICHERIFSNETITTTESVIDNDAADQNGIIGFIESLQKCMNYIVKLLRDTVIRSPVEFIKTYSSLMRSIQLFVNTYMDSMNKDLHQNLLELIVSILEAIWCLSDKIELIPMFIDTDYAIKIIEWISTKTFESHIKELTIPIFSIIHNLSRIKSGLKLFHTEKTFNVLMERKQPIIELDDKDITEAFGEVMISLAKSDPQRSQNKAIIISTTQALYKRCKKANATEDLKPDGYHLSEILELLHCAFFDNNVLKHILDNTENEKPIEFFAQLLLSFYGVLLDSEPDDLEKRVVDSLLKILLQISNCPNYSEELKQNNHFYLIIASLAKRTKRNDVKHIWWNIRSTPVPNKDISQSTPKVYVSYHWTDEQFCKQFVEILRKEITIPIWVDYKNAKLSDNDTWDDSSSVIQSATIIIALVSTNYTENDDKIQEFSYIISTIALRDKKKQLIIVEVEPKFSFDQWSMKDSLEGRTIISYDKEMRKTVSQVSEQIGESKRQPLIRCLPWPFNRSRKKTNNLSKNRTHKSIPTDNFNSTSITLDISDGTSDSTNDPTVPFVAKSHSSSSVVFDQTGSGDRLSRV